MLSAALTGGRTANILTEALVTLANVVNWVTIDDDAGGNADGVGGNVRDGTALDNITGGAEDDTILLDQGGNDVVDGAGGDDTITVNFAAAHDLTGGSGDDTFIFLSRLHLDAANTIAGGTGYDTIDVTQSADLDYAAALSNISGIDQLLISGIGDKTLTVGNDVVAQSDLGTSIGVGSTGTFTLSAALTGGNRANITTEALVTLANVANWVSIDDDVGGNADGVGGLVQLGTAGDNITGGAEDDVVTLGTAGGVDTVSLGGGDDTINTTVANLEDTDVITGGAGDDTLSTDGDRRRPHWISRPRP